MVNFVEGQEGSTVFSHPCFISHLLPLHGTSFYPQLNAKRFAIIAIMVLRNWVHPEPV